MRKIFNKKTFSFSNVIFILAVVVLLYPPSREWFMRQVAFSPSINDIEEVEKIESYNWNLKGLNTSNIDFKNFEGEVVFVNFWATWCPPCRAEMPMIQDLYNDYSEKVRFVLVTTENWETVEKYFEENNYDLPVYSSINVPPSNLTKTNSIPASYLIDRKGNIVIDKVGAANWESDKIREFIDSLIKK